MGLAWSFLGWLWTSPYSVPSESLSLLWDGIVNNPLHSTAPDDLKEAAKAVEFVGTDEPGAPINWRFAESISAIKGFQAAMLNVLLKRKYGIDYQRVVINTDHAQLFVMSVFFPIIDPHGEKVEAVPNEKFFRYFPNCNIYAQRLTSPCTNIYRTKDNRFYHIHGSLNHTVPQKALEITDEEELAPFEEGRQAYQDKIAQMDSKDLDELMNVKHRQAGTICMTQEEYLASEHGKANSQIGLYEIHHIPNQKQAASWWGTPESVEASPKRPLFGLKVVDLTRMIASPVVCRELAEMGASVMRITSPNIPDLCHLNLDMQWGKWNAHLDLRRDEDRLTLRELIEEADVVVDGYRPGVMEKWGFGKNDVLDLFKDKERGIVYARENCYGWNGPLSHLSGWQQISDAHCGASYAYGKAMGNDEPVTPVWPNSDYCTGAAGAVGILEALLKRAESGGSCVVDIALNYYSQWLINSCGTYSQEVWERVWDRFDRPVFRHWDSMGVTIPYYLEALRKADSPILNPDFFEDREDKAIGAPVRTVRPILTFPEGRVTLGYNVGSRGNGVDRPRWPKDLLTEVVV
ncbi:CAIB/BAIF family enzyme [Coprinopsis marcescibilis]|uniref:CAIB/BAIF family enzyme n=1 Tax=Coprinopsis marcescibilis TaxID=230819 RepID=A0A5C3KGI4_COPMA|nr:CAIB/BAIF family enzyme [Coprinopsis marcescibilis]